MKIIVDISEDTYNYIKANGARIPYYKLTDAIKNGTPLPKNHGRLIDADALWRKWVFDAIGKQEIDEAPTVIEVDVSKRRKGTPLEENDSGYNCENWIP